MKFDKRSFRKRGRRAVYNGREYKAASSSLPGMVKITSFDQKDLDNGFYCEESWEFMKKYGFFCYKDVPKNEIAAAYKIEFTANYKGKTYYHVDGYVGDDCEDKENAENIVRIMKCVSKHSKPDEYAYCIANGFIEGSQLEYSYVDLYKYVNINDPELEIIETRTEVYIDENGTEIPYSRLDLHNIEKQ